MTIQSHEVIDAREATELHLRELLNLLRRRWRLIVTAACTAIVLAGAVGLGFPPRYTAIASVIVDPPKASSGAGDPSVVGVLDDPGVQTHVAALLSENHLQQVFESLVAERGPEPKERRNLLGLEEFSIDSFKNRMNAFKDSHSRMVGITYISTDPAFAAAVATRSMELYLATLRDRDLTDRKDALRSLRDRIPLVRAELVRADAALQSYRIQHGLSEANGRDMVDQQLVEFVKHVFGATGEYRPDRPAVLTIGDSMLMISEAGVRDAAWTVPISGQDCFYVPSRCSLAGCLRFSDFAFTHRPSLPHPRSFPPPSDWAWPDRR